jgi:predicted RNA-binding Zn-ribbon protein involved in translation (DUF1610 family)
MPRNAPPGATRIPYEVVFGKKPLPLEVAAHYAWTTVTGTVASRVQTEKGRRKGASVNRISFACPNCGEESHFHAAAASGSHVVACRCDGQLVFRVIWAPAK